MKHLLLVDGMALLFRSFFASAAMNQYIRLEDGTPTNGVQGFVRHVMTAETIFQPTHIAICWDMGAHTFRNELYDGYKANRPAPPEEMKPQFDLAKRISVELGWTNFGQIGMEADDSIGSMVEKWKHDAKITVISGDRDLLQLLNPSTTIALTKKGYTQYELYDETRFIEEYGIAPASFADVKAFMGDSSDGYPGIKGIGPKTALQLIQTYGSIEGVLANLDALKPAQRTKIVDGLDMLRLSHQLATIQCSMDIVLQLDDLTRSSYTEAHEQMLHDKGYRLIVKHAKSLGVL
ncbi:MAG: 5'-3' exonuclease [Caryophanon sp.]|nr:5'-3' exonuclease [Caryophanon sp.]